MPRRPALAALGLLGLLASASCTSAPSIPRRANASAAPKPSTPSNVAGAPTVPTVNAPLEAASEQQAELWLSYQIRIEAIDGAPTDIGPDGPCIYYRLPLPAGEHTLLLRLDYQAPLEHVRAANPVETTVELQADTAYRLFDLNAGRKRARDFVPYVSAGAPPDEELALERPGR